jgi:YD repeat-containing protein
LALPSSGFYEKLWFDPFSQLSLTNYFVYDEAGRLTYVTNANNELLKFTNSAAGDLVSLTDGKGNLVQLRRFVVSPGGHIGSHIV